MKKKKVWNSPNGAGVSLRPEDSIRKILCNIREGRSPVVRDEDDLLETLAKQLQRIDGLKDAKVKLELLARVLNTDALLSKFDSEDLADLYAETSEYFVEEAAEFDDKGYLAAVVHDLVVRHSGEDGRAAVFFSLSEFLPEDMIRAMIEEVMNTVESHDLENEDNALLALSDIADGINDADMYEKVNFLLYPNRENSVLIDVANVYLSAGRLADVKRLMAEVKFPKDEDFEDYLDLKVAVAEQEGRHGEAASVAEELYENFPSEMNLGKVLGIVSDARRKELLDAHEKFRLGTTMTAGYLQILEAYNEFARMQSYIDRFGEEALAALPADVLTPIVESLDTKKQTELAERIRRWIVEEPEDLRDDDD